MAVNVSYLGPAGTFTEAALRQFEKLGTVGGEIKPIPVDSPAAALSLVGGDADYACVAIENSVDGPVTPTFDALAATPNMKIYAETDINISFAIMVRPGTTQVRTFSTHPVARQQVAAWVEKTWPSVEYIPASSNAAAAQAVAEKKVDAAAAPPRAAELFKLKIVAENIADIANARTRFVLVGPAGTPPPRSGNDRSSVIFTLPNKPGSLVAALTEFSKRGVDLTRIESRPTRTGIGTYRFHIDLAGHIDDTPVATALEALQQHCNDMRFLGSWPGQ